MSHREDLLEGALRALLEKGYARTTARDIVFLSGTNLGSAGLSIEFGQTGAVFPSSQSRQLSVLGDGRRVTSNAILSGTARLFDRRAGVGNNPLLEGIGTPWVDVGMRGMNGIELATALRQQHPAIRVLMLSMYDNREYVLSAIRAGARGYVLKESPTEEIIAAIGVVCAGGNYFSAQVSSLVLQSGTAPPQLTAREHEVLLLLAHGRSNKLVARQLDISVRTVETHRLSLRRKLGVDSASELLKIAVTNGWTTL